MKPFLLAFAATIVIAMPAQAEEKAETAQAAVKADKKPKKIKDRRHPDYVRCRSEPIIGSLARKRRICMTNREWIAHNNEGNRRSKEFVQDMQTGMNTSN